MIRTNCDGRDSLQRYLEDVSASQPLSAREEGVLSCLIQNGDLEARAKLVNANLRFVITIAREYQYRGMSLEDLISAGNLGLVTATDRFDGTRGFKFISYAVWWIRQAILQTLAENSRLVRLPSNRVNLLCRISRYLSSQQETPNHPSMEEIAEALGVSADEVVVTLNSGQRMLSLDASFGDDSENNLLKTVPDDSQASPDVLLMENSLREAIESALDGLKEREREVIRLYFGLDVTQPKMNLEEIGLKYGLTRERIRQIKDKALSKLRHPKRAANLRSYYAEEV